MKWKVLSRKVDNLIEQILINRGLDSKKKDNFFNSKLSDFEADFKIEGIKKSQDRINRAIKNGELIVVFGDYDVDGVCATAILYKSLTSIGAKVLPYIPHREKEGYGLSKLGLEFAKKSGAAVVITVDNGIVAFSQADYAKELGLDLIITDHHSVQGKKPDAFSIVHSTKMCGAAVAWCLVRDLIRKDQATELLQFVAIATICDLIPLLGLGRSFVIEGLKILNNTNNLGLLALINESRIKPGSIGSYEIGYVLGPRLNAVGRIEHAIDALRLICTKDPSKARNLAEMLCKANVERQKLTSIAIDQARLLVNKKNRVHVLYSKEWSSGIIGLVAGKITEEFNRPSVAISLGTNIAKGSARSVNGIDIVEVIRRCEDILIDVGGHPGAAGFSILSEHVEIFKQRIEGYVVDVSEEAERVLEIDAEVKIDQITKELIKQINQFEPFGFKNPKPIFIVKEMKVSDPKTVGEGKHLKFKADGLDVIAFGMGELVSSLKNGSVIDLAFTPEINAYNGSEKIQLKAKDIKLF